MQLRQKKGSVVIFAHICLISRNKKGRRVDDKNVEKWRKKKATEWEEEKKECGQRKRFALVNVTVNIGLNRVNAGPLFEFLLFI